MNKPRKYIIFRADWKEPKGTTEVNLPTWGMTWILAEHFDSSGKPTPEPGYRLTESIQVKQFIDPNRPGAATHSRVGDWEVDRVEEYQTNTPSSEFDAIVVCYCRYSPIESPLKPLSKPIVSLDSFGGDEAAYQRWLEQNRDNPSYKVKEPQPQ